MHRKALGEVEPVRGGLGGALLAPSLPPLPPLLVSAAGEHEMLRPTGAGGRRGTLDVGTFPLDWFEETNSFGTLLRRSVRLGLATAMQIIKYSEFPLICTLK